MDSKVLAKHKAKVNTKDTFDVFLIHEALDRSYIQLQSLELALNEHPVIQNDKQSNALYQTAVEALASLYQHLGNITPENSKDK